MPLTIKHSIKQAEERKLESWDILDTGYQQAFLRHNEEEMQRIVTKGAGKAGTEDVLLGEQASTEAYYGRLSKAQEFTGRAAESALRNDAKDTAAAYYSGLAVAQAYSGLSRQAIVNIDRALKLGANLTVKDDAAFVLGFTGQMARAEALAALINKEFPVATLQQRYWIPVIRAAAELYRKKPDKVVALLQAVTPCGTQSDVLEGNRASAFFPGRTRLARSQAPGSVSFSPRLRSCGR